MSTNGYVEVFDAPSADAVASRVAAALDSMSEPQGSGLWLVDGPDWLIRVQADDLDDDPHRTALVVVWRDGTEAGPLHALTDTVFDHLSRATSWGLRSSSDLETSYLSRYRARR